MQFLSDWQTLIGSILGGAFALTTALIVARSARRRDELASGMVVTATLAQVLVVSDTLEALSLKDNINQEEYPYWFSEKLVHSHPSMPVLFESSVARLMLSNVTLAAHLCLFQITYIEIETLLKRIANDFDWLHRNGKTIRPNELTKAECRIITKHFKTAVEHAICAQYLVGRLVLSRIYLWHRIRRLIWLNKKEKECDRILENTTIQEKIMSLKTKFK